MKKSLLAHPIADSERDKEWDTFLTSHPIGQFQQSSLWAAVKRFDQWQCTRQTLLQEGKIVGGFQILHKKTRGLRIGYVSKGPVLHPAHAPLADQLLCRLLDTVREQRIQALIVQPPDICKEFPPRLAHPPFLPNRIVSVIQANCEIALQDGAEQVQQQMRASKREEARQAVKRGVVIREAGEGDLETFFHLMIESCARQGSEKPNPSNIESLNALWRAFHPNDFLRLDIAEIEGKPVAGLLSIAFGSRVTFWKKGWSGEFARRHPNTLLNLHAIRWAASHEFQTCDFAAMSPDLATALLADTPLTQEQKKSRDFFNLGFCGHPVLLPEARLYIQHPALRILYRMWVKTQM